jgi:sigma-B regulation protein RsbU (phosphoserine phosphatase)
MSTPPPGPVDAPHTPSISVTAEVLHAVRVVVNAYRLSTESRDVDVSLNGLLDGVAQLVPFDAAGVYVLGRSNRRVLHWLWRGEGGPPPGRRDPIEKHGAVARAIELGTPVATNCTADDPAAAGFGFVSCLVVPVIGPHGVVMGAIEVHSTRSDAFAANAVEMLQLLGTVVAGTIERARLKEEVREKRRIDSDLLVARQVMEDLIPRTIPALRGFDVAGVNEASFEVGGDYYEFIPLPDDRWGIVIADVVGKGIGAALLVSAIRASMYALVGRELATRAVMRRANRFFHDSVEEGKYVTLFYAVLDVPSRRMIYVNAGHQPPIVLRANGDVEELRSGGVPLGMFKSPRYFEGVAALDVGDLFVLYTDGIVESSDARDNHYGRGRLVSTLEAFRTEPAEDICGHVMQDVRTFSFGSQDDRTLLVLKATEDEA